MSKNILPASAFSAENILPKDWREATLVGRMMTEDGPIVVCIRPDGAVIDITGISLTTRRLSASTTSQLPLSTTSQLFEAVNPAEEAIKAATIGARTGKNIGYINEILSNQAGVKYPYLLAPNDLQDVLAAGVTFAASLVERLVEEESMKSARNADGTLNQDKLDEVRATIRSDIVKLAGTDDFSKIIPGSGVAMSLLERVKEDKMSTVYPQVGLGKEIEIFYKASPMTTVGHGAQAGYSPSQEGEIAWTNPEPEVVLFANSRGEIIGASHGNDVNDRAREGRSPLLLYQAKVQNGSAVIGPFIRLFDEKFKLSDIDKIRVGLDVFRANGEKQFEGYSDMSAISRRPEEIVKAAMPASRGCPSGAAVFLGTMIIPLKDSKGKPFTHEEGDVVRVGSDKLGSITNCMVPSDRVQHQDIYGVLALMGNLATRGLLSDLAKGHSR